MRLVSAFLLCCIVASGFAQSLPRRPFLGAGIAAGTGGVKITAVTPNTTASAAGLRLDDVVTSIAGQTTADPAALNLVLAKWKTGDKVKIEFVRAEKPQVVEVTVQPRPVDSGDNYTTIYDEVKSHGNRIRIIVTKPKATGKRPVLFLIQGIGYVSNEQPLTGGSGYPPILKAFSDKGYVTVRVEKPGLGDSEGGPADKVDFDTELDAFRQALLKTKTYDFVDPNNILIFGHSMGGCEGPMLAAEIPVKGIAVYGTVVRTWHEYLVEMMRSQSALGGANASDLDGLERNTIAALHLVFNERQSPADAKKNNPKWAAAIDGIFPDGEHFSGVGINFWQGCFAQNYAKAWETLDSNVLSLYGECDFVAEQVDHPMIAEIVNSKHPGKAKYVMVPNSDHAFRNVASKRESLEFWTKGGKAFNPAICDILTKWADEIIPPSAG
ncbi:hypothetical protein BH11ARM1_BH11ARM1_03740 [soil metagenome]